MKFEVESISADEFQRLHQSSLALHILKHRLWLSQHLTAEAIEFRSANISVARRSK